MASTTDMQFKAALVVVDFQNDFCPKDPEDAESKDGSLKVEGGRDILDPVNKLLSMPFAYKVATQDWHPEGHVSFAATHNLREFTDQYVFRDPNNPSRSKESTAWPKHCVQGSYGAELVRGLDKFSLDDFIKKGKDSRVEMYSAFYDDFRVEDSGLLGKLRDKGITDVFVVGLAEDYCVRATAEHAAEAGFKTYVVLDATRPVNSQFLKDNPPDTAEWRVKMKEANISLVQIDGEEVKKVNK